MAEHILDVVQRLVEQLSPYEQAQLLGTLALQMADAVTSTPPPAAGRENTESWNEFFQLGDALANSDTPETETLTAAVLAMRR